MPPKAAEKEEVLEAEVEKEEPKEQLGEQESFFSNESFELEDVPDEEEVTPKEELKVGGEASDEDDGEAVDEEEREEVDTEEGEKEPAAEPAAEPQAAPSAEPPEPAAKPEPAPEPASAPAPDQEPAPQLTNEQMQEQMREWQDKTLASLADYYALDEETVAQIEEDPSVLAKQLPQLAARVHLASVQATTQALMQNLPSVIQAQSQQSAAASRSEDTFFEKWPQIDRSNPQHMQTVQRVAVAYREANKGRQVPEEQFINEVGAQAIISLGMLNELVAAQAGAQAPAQPAVQPAQQQSFVPAGQSAPRGTGRPRQANQIEAFDFAAFEEDDIDLD